MQCILSNKSLDWATKKWKARSCGSSNWPTSVEPQAYAKCTWRSVTNPRNPGKGVSPTPTPTLSIAGECTNGKVVPIHIFCESLSCTYQKMPKEEAQRAKTFFLYSRIYPLFRFDPTRKGPQTFLIYISAGAGAGAGAGTWPKRGIRWGWAEQTFPRQRRGNLKPF